MGSPAASHLITGRRGERAARQALAGLGLDILELNFSVPDTGEVDIVARDGATLVFIEVKTRRRTDWGRPADAVDEAKRLRLRHTAELWMRRRRLLHLPARFDIVEVYWHPWPWRRRLLVWPAAF